jgi:MFS family permease
MIEENKGTESSEDIPSSSDESYQSLNIILYILFAVGPLVGNAVLVLLGAISTDFMVNPTVVLSSIPAFMFPFALFQLFSGSISDTYGRVPVIASGLIVYVIGLLITALASNMDLFVIGNGVSGIGFGLVNPVLLALLTDTALPIDIPKRMGIATALASLSVGLGPFIAGQMIVLGWQSYYLMFLIITVVCLIVLSVVKRPPKIDRKETELSSFLTDLGSELKKSIVLLILVTTFLVALSQLGVYVWTSRALSGVIDDRTIGFLLLGAGISGTIMGALLGPLSRRYGFGPLIVLGFIGLFSGLWILILIGNTLTASSVLFVGVALIGIGWAGGALLPTMITYSQVISPEHRGVLAGVVTFSSFTGAALNPIMFAPLYRIGLQTVYIVMLVMSFILVLFFANVYRKVGL